MLASLPVSDDQSTQMWKVRTHRRVWSQFKVKAAVQQRHLSPHSKAGVRFSATFPSFIYTHYQMAGQQFTARASESLWTSDYYGCDVSRALWQKVFLGLLIWCFLILKKEKPHILWRFFESDQRTETKKQMNDISDDEASAPNSIKTGWLNGSMSCFLFFSTDWTCVCFVFVTSHTHC